MELSALGLPFPATTNYHTGLIEFVANLKRNEIEKLNLRVPFFIETISNAGAIGEIHFGKSGVSEHLVYINEFWGLGVGVCINGKIYFRVFGFRGEIGTFNHPYERQKVFMRESGMLGSLCLGQSIIRLYSDQPINVKSIDEIVQRFRNNDSEVVSAIYELTQYLALGLVNVINAYIPSGNGRQS